MKLHGENVCLYLWIICLESENMYQLILSDLDETLLVNHHVPKVNQEAIAKLPKETKFVVATGSRYISKRK